MSSWHHPVSVQHWGHPKDMTFLFTVGLEEVSIEKENPWGMLPHAIIWEVWSGKNGIFPIIKNGKF